MKKINEVKFVGLKRQFSNLELELTAKFQEVCSSG